MKVSRRKKNQRQQAYSKTAAAIKTLRNCLNCGQPGPHFAPPGFGTPGFFMCANEGD